MLHSDGGGLATYLVQAATNDTSGAPEDSVSSCMFTVRCGWSYSYQQPRYVQKRSATLIASLLQQHWAPNRQGQNHKMTALVPAEQLGAHAPAAVHQSVGFVAITDQGLRHCPLNSWGNLSSEKTQLRGCFENVNNIRTDSFWDTINTSLMTSTVQKPCAPGIQKKGEPTRTA